MDVSGKKNFLGLAGELSALGAGVFALFFLYGFSEYRAFMDGLGVDWGGAVQLPTTYAIRSTDMFMSVAPYLIMAFAGLRYTSSEAALRIMLILSIAVGFVYMLLAIWIVRFEYPKSIPETARLISEWAQFAYMTLGVYMAVVLAVFIRLNKYGSWVAISSVLCIYVFLLVFPTTMGRTKGYVIRSNKAENLSYVLDGGVKWFVVDYQVGGSLLVRYKNVNEPIIMYKAIEGIEVRRSSEK